MLIVFDNDHHTGRGICLIGFMGAGKTTVGRALAQTLGWNFTDLDEVVEAREKRSIAEIFRDAGEPVFRHLEKEALRAVLSQSDLGHAVIAVGGGAFAEPENTQALHQAGLCIVFLDAPVEELRRRCAAQGSTRPLFRDEERFRELYELRRDYYKKADLLVETTGLTPLEAASEVLKHLKLGGA